MFDHRLSTSPISLFYYYFSKASPQHSYTWFHHDDINNFIEKMLLIYEQKLNYFKKTL